MGERTRQDLPDPEREAVKVWLAALDPEYVHDTGWVEINKRFHDLVMAARTYLNRHYPENNARRAAYDGLTLGLLAVLHFHDTQRFEELLNSDPLAEGTPLTIPVLEQPGPEAPKTDTASDGGA